jgi:hypothetical protein
LVTPPATNPTQHDPHQPGKPESHWLLVHYKNETHLQKGEPRRPRQLIEPSQVNLENIWGTWPWYKNIFLLPIDKKSLSKCTHYNKRSADSVHKSSIVQYNTVWSLFKITGT